MPFEIEMTEKTMRNNAPIELFAVDGVSVKVKLLGSARAEEWAESLGELNVVDAQINALTMRSLSTATDAKALRKGEADKAKLFKEKRLHVRKALFDYAPEVMTPEVLDGASALQIESALAFLRKWADPFVVGKTLDDLANKDQMRLSLQMLDAAGKVKNLQP